MEKKDYTTLVDFIIGMIKQYDKKNADALMIVKDSWVQFLILILRDSVQSGDKELSEKIYQFLLEELIWEK